jgi:hypothetical protein
MPFPLLVPNRSIIPVPRRGNARQQDSGRNQQSRKANEFSHHFVLPI